MKNFSFGTENSSQNLEEKLLATIICCNESLSSDYNKKLNYHNNMMKLFESVTGIQTITKEYYSSQNLIDFNNYHGNKYAYSKDVLSLLQDYGDNSYGTIKSLNESLTDNFNITTFQKELSEYILNLSHDNDFDKLDTLSPTIIKTKVFSKKPLYVYGFDIFNNFGLRKELELTFKLNMNDCISILFDKSNRQLLFVFNHRIITYILENNSFGYYNQVWKELDEWFIPIEEISSITRDNYYSFISENINSNLLELHKVIDSSKYKFEDNLYFDKKKTKENVDNLMFRQNNLFIKS